MQNNVTELTQKLLRALDADYNVIDMPTVIEVISLLERVAITKELLEATRLGRHVNELRRNTTNESLARRAKELVKKWRSLVLPESNGQLKPSSEDASKSKRRPPKIDSGGGGVAGTLPKRSRLNGAGAEFDLSDNSSNSSFKDVIFRGADHHVGNNNRRPGGGDVIVINSEPTNEDPRQQPKKRGRKKGSKNHRNLIDEAETSFSNKMAVSRGNAKVKTTQELIASLQNKSAATLGGVVSQSKTTKEDLVEKAAKLTERVSIIDQKLNSQSLGGGRYKNSQKRKSEALNLDDKSHTDDEIIVVDEEESDSNPLPTKVEVIKEEFQSEDGAAASRSLSVEEASALLPPVDKSRLCETDEDDTPCTCSLREIEEVETDTPTASHHNQPRFEFEEDCDCRARARLRDKYHLGEDAVCEDRLLELRDSFIPELNGNYSEGVSDREPRLSEDGLYANVVPNRGTESIPKRFEGENFKRYSISERGEGVEDDGGGGRTFREWHEVVESPSYNGEVLRILPYVIID